MFAFPQKETASLLTYTQRPASQIPRPEHSQGHPEASTTLSIAQESPPTV